MVLISYLVFLMGISLEPRKLEKYSPEKTTAQTFITIVGLDSEIVVSIDLHENLPYRASP